ncbi:MAG: DUF4255 domain-containing protein [Cellulomonas sp.]|jgi:Pvc16 N-terminal domain|uniref:DUF4255 domain-containing protein n=1 Tax=Cellulomonas sp. TaxID=40001 RepID=UPI0019FB77A3|nr:DUF4255 domain-containing protein [Cellulomonas sp.]MBF0686757.1 DUF4255 domain-containing protein [Cellulomonas sp.]
MSNSLAVATVSAVLRARVQGLIDAAELAGFTVVTAPPEPDAVAGVYIHLYQVMPDGDLRNEWMPERDTDGSVLQAPRLAVDLMYALSFVGAPAAQDVERLAGLVLGSLNQVPRLSPAEIADFLTALPAGHALAGSDLANQVESVRLSMVPLDLEDLSRLWGMNTRSAPRLTVAYRAAVVMLDAQVTTGASLPVTREPVLTVYPLRRPQVSAVRSDARPQPVVRFGEHLVVTGTSLRGDRTTVLVGGRALPAPSAGDTEIRLPVDGGTLRPGLTGVQVRHEVTLPDGSTRPAAESGLFPVALVPVIEPANPSSRAAPGAGARVLRLTVTPVPAADEPFTVVLNGPGDTRTEWSDGAVVGGVVEVTTRGLPSGPHLVRLSIGGALSLLDVDPATGAITGPTVTVP